MPITILIDEPLTEIDKKLKKWGYKLSSIGEPEKKDELYHRLSIYTRKKDEVKVYQKYSDEEGISPMVPSSEITLIYEGSLDGLGELRVLEKIR